MFVYKFNEYTGKYYTYDLDEHDYFAPMFEESLHDSKDLQWFENGNSTVCKHCNTDFEGHGRLLHHLAYHNYDISAFVTKKKRNTAHPEWGDHGMMPFAMKRKSKKSKVNELAQDMMRLIDIKKK